MPEQEYPSDPLSAQGVAVQVEDDCEQPGFQVLSARPEKPVPDRPKPGLLEKVFGLGPISRQMKNKPEDIGLVEVVSRFKLSTAIHLNT